MGGHRQQEPSCPMPRSRVLDEYFMEHRAKVIDVAAFLDRIDRAPVDGPAGPGEDERVVAFRRALSELASAGPGRVARILNLLSDPTTEPIAAASEKGAAGYYHRGSADGVDDA